MYLCVWDINLAALTMVQLDFGTVPDSVFFHFILNLKETNR